MAISAGSRVGPYEIVAQIGAGGMGEVYRATDTNLKRSVAIKVLPEAAVADPDRLARFQREAEVLAALNHPNIAAIHGLERSGDITALVMELVDGPTLADVIAEGPIPVADALAIARQIAEALEAAHDRAIVHRDLKPANIKTNGRVKVLDFGLAKVVAAGESVDHSKSPTISVAATRAGVILGTAAYMSPEQAKGRIADARSDIWAFGVVLFEMLTGKPAFAGETSMDVLGSVIKDDVDWASLPGTTPSIVRAVIRRCLQKDPSRRLRDIADARFQIEEALTEQPLEAVTVVRRRSGRQVVLSTGAIIVAIAAGVAATATYLGRTRAGGDELRLEITTGAGNPNAFAISPDGSQVAYHGTVRDRTGLWLRSLQSETPRLLTDNAAYPFWSPDGRSIGFAAGGKLNRIDATGGAIQPIADVQGFRGGAWNRDGVILFAQTAGPILRVSAGGGQPVEATTLLPSQATHRFPNFLPDRRRFFFYAGGTPDVRGLYIGSLDSRDARRLADAETSGVFAPPDFVLFARQATLYAQHLDLDTMTPVGEPIVITDKVEMGDLAQVGRLAHSASLTGRLAYRAKNLNTARQLTWFDGTGRPLSTLGEPDRSEKDTPRLSPDGRYVVVCRSVDGNANLWLIETARGVARPLTSDTVFEGRPVWSPDSAQLAFNSYKKGKTDIYLTSIAGSSTERSLFETAGSKDPWDWSRNGFVLYSDIANGGLWALPLHGEKKPILVNRRAGGSARFSPDGRWVAYSSTESGNPEIYIQAFPGPGSPTPISTNGGRWPEWRGDSRELFYLTQDDTIMSVRLTPRGQTLEPGTPQRLFSIRIQPPRPFSSGTQYTVSPDGQRFLVNALVGEGETVPLTVVLNWQPTR